MLRRVASYWPWFPVWVVGGSFLLAVISGIPFSDYYVYPIRQLLGWFWGGLFRGIGSGTIVSVLVLLFIVLLIVVIVIYRKDSTRAGLFVAYLLICIVSAIGAVLVGPVLSSLSDTQPEPLTLQTDDHFYHATVFASTSDGTSYNLHECDRYRVLCRSVARFRGNLYLSYGQAPPPMSLEPTGDGVQLIEDGDVVYTYPEE